LEDIISINNVNLIGIAGWKFVPAEPRHNNFHQAISVEANSQHLPIRYLGLKNTTKADWVTQVLPDTVLKRFPYISPVGYFKVIRSLKLQGEFRTVIYIFEGSFLWLILIKLLSRLIPNSSVVCNLFSSSKYSKVLFNKGKIRAPYSLALRILNRFENIHLTFDTQLMTDKVNLALGRNQFQNVFPLPSALPYLTEKKYSPEGHHRVLVNMRDFEISTFHDLISGSCPDCTFVLPRGPLASTPLWFEFGKYPNLVFDEANIPVDEYLNYVDQFDYMIFLYRPSIDSSGRLLDAIVRRIPVCIPRQSTEWCLIARDFGELHQYDWLTTDGKRANFNHPSFSDVAVEKIPEFTPTGAINSLSDFACIEKKGGITKKFVSKISSVILIYFYWCFALIANSIFSAVSLVKLIVQKLR
jgi:hypothetical protein